ncbi:hypothetical protein H072_4203 [Dactylellina haptotyla CBS 200.50]|uniref:Mitochondrial import inner membrane translocase subunit TIM22 n=1 Tax=Dactylellina haptotyla (strain CBS 200.50) TaxID=1284197 RepID=S8AG76_DACHA|nr:hypothetical protein H072_4203 [Dactylellina haptotyla CBS 200.50]
MPSPSSPPAPASHSAGYPLPAPDLKPSDRELPPSPSSTSHLTARLGMHPLTRLTIANLFAFASVFLTTATKTAHTSSLQFRAENAHRLPKSQRDWYFYHRSRSYYASQSAFSQGFRRAMGMCGYVSLFLMVENGVDVARGSVDFGGTMVGGGVTGAFFGVVRKLPLSTTMVTVKKGLWYGFLYGVLQDVMLAAEGNRVFWIEPFVGRTRQVIRQRRGKEIIDEEEKRGSLQENGS